jgi:hypothetical protein
MPIKGVNILRSLKTVFSKPTIDFHKGSVKKEQGTGLRLSACGLGDLASDYVPRSIVSRPARFTPKQLMPKSTLPVSVIDAFLTDMVKMHLT